MRLIAHTYLSSRGVHRNNEVIQVEQTEDSNWLKALYQTLGADYPKFYKMDDLSKMAVLGSLLLDEELSTLQSKENDLSLIFANHSASARTDLKFIESYEELGNPSPSLFVYTLPNILTGELAIRHKWYGENSFYILPAFEESFFIDQLKLAFINGHEAALCGWVEASVSGEEECFLFLVHRDGDQPLELSKLINTYRK